jgi:quercetin dioxygenase-like cupin family protein
MRASSMCPGGSTSRTVGRDASVMDIVTLSDAPGYDPERVVARPFLEGSQCNVRVIRLSPGQALPPHTHGASDLMLFAVEGEGMLHAGDGTVRFATGSLAFYRGDEELRVANTGPGGLTLLAFLAPPFPPAAGT